MIIMKGSLLLLTKVNLLLLLAKLHIHHLMRRLDEIFDEFNFDLIIFLDQLNVIYDFSAWTQKKTTDSCLWLDSELRSNPIAKRPYSIICLVNMHKNGSEILSSLNTY